MTSVKDLLAMAAPEPMGRKHDSNPDDRRRHIDVAVDRILHKMTVDEIRVRHGISRTSVYRYIDYALSYDGNVPAILRRALTA